VKFPTGNFERLRAKIGVLLVLAALAGLAAAPDAGAAVSPAASPTFARPKPSDLHQVSPRDQRAWLHGIRLANRSDVVQRLAQRHPHMVSDRFGPHGTCCMFVWYGDGPKEIALVKVDVHTGAILEQWTGYAIAWQMARGYPGEFGHVFNSPWVLIPLGLLFLAPFVDPRRPFRLLHLDLLVLLGFGVSHVFFNAARVDVSVPLVYPVLGYLLVRMAVVGFRPRPARRPLVPYASATVLLVATAALFAGRVTLNLVDSNVIDVGYAGVIGANHIAKGDELYDGHFAKDPSDGDTYGPVNYLLYLPFERTIGWSGKWDALPAAHGAAILFDFLVVAGMFLLGRRIRPGPDGRLLGAALAFAWTAYPYSLFVLMSNSNDSLVAATAVFALVAAGSPVRRGIAIGAGAAAKFTTLVLAPLFATTALDRRRNAWLWFAVAVAAVLVVSIVPFLPPGGVRQFYDRTLGFQLGRSSPFSIWGQHPGLHGLRVGVEVMAVNFAVLLLVVPARKTVVQLAALGAAATIALQLATIHWFYLYVVWFAPLVLAALFLPFFAGGEVDEPRPERRAEPVAVAG
jgi:hypothetical protein